MLKEIIAKNHFSFHESFPNWEEAIAASYTPLLKEGIVEQQYIQAVIDCVKQYGPYIVIIPQVAMPHSTEGATGCHATAISFMKVKNEVDFDPSDPDKKATLFFSLASTDHEKHIENLQQLMDTLMNEELLEKLLKINTIEELTALANEFET